MVGTIETPRSKKRSIKSGEAAALLGLILYRVNNDAFQIVG
jgi:hypothetical protein